MRTITPTIARVYARAAGVVYPVPIGFSALFLWTGTRIFRKRVIT